MKRTAFLLAAILGASALAEAQTTIYFKRDTIYAGPGVGAIATVTPASSDTTAPTAPSSLGTTSTTATSVVLAWTGSSDSGGSGLAGYKIYRARTSGGASLPVGTVNSSSTGFTDQPLEPNTGYIYTIVAFDNAQNHSSASNSVNPTTSTAASDTTAPSTPANLTASLLSRNSVRVNWNASTDIGGSGIRGYKVYRDNTLVSGSNPITAAFFDQTGLSYKTAYAYKVEAVDIANNVSAQTSAVNITTARQLIFSDGFSFAGSQDYPYLDAPWTFDDSLFGRLGVSGMQATSWADYTVPVMYGAMIDPGTQSFKATVDIVRNDWAYAYEAGMLLYPQIGSGWTHAYRVVLSQSYAAGGVAILDCPDIYDWEACGLTTWDWFVSPPTTGTLSVETNASTGNIKVFVNGTQKLNISVDPGTMSGGVGLMGGGFIYYSSPKLSVFDNFVLEAN